MPQVNEMSWMMVYPLVLVLIISVMAMISFFPLYFCCTHVSMNFKKKFLI